MQLSEIENKLNAKRKVLEKENAVLEKSRSKVSTVKNDIAELEKQLLSKKIDELLTLFKSENIMIDKVIDLFGIIKLKNLTIDEVIELVNSHSNASCTNTSLKEKNTIKTLENNKDGKNDE